MVLLGPSSFFWSDNHGPLATKPVRLYPHERFGTAGHYLERPVQKNQYPLRGSALYSSILLGVGIIIAIVVIIFHAP